VDTTGNVGIGGITTPLSSFHVGTTDGIIIPVGDSTQRLAVTGIIRFNSTLGTFEGYKGASWGTLGELIDVDRDTYISAENSTGADNDELKFG
jgi:hypothetical protein